MLHGGMSRAWLSKVKKEVFRLRVRHFRYFGVDRSGRFRGALHVAVVLSSDNLARPLKN